jgi:hypothetical protein
MKISFAQQCIFWKYNGGKAQQRLPCTERELDRYAGHSREANAGETGTARSTAGARRSSLMKRYARNGTE